MENQLYICRHGEFDISKFIFDLSTNYSNAKPRHAFWTSSSYYDENSKARSSWLDYLESGDGVGLEDFITDYRYIITPKKDAKILYVDKPNDFTDIFGFDEMNYFKIREKYDGIHFSEKLATAYRNGSFWIGFINQMKTFMDLIQLIDVESTVWFNTDFIQEIKPIKE